MSEASSPKCRRGKCPKVCHDKKVCGPDPCDPCKNKCLCEHGCKDECKERKIVEVMKPCDLPCDPKKAMELLEIESICHCQKDYACLSYGMKPKMFDPLKSARKCLYKPCLRGLPPCCDGKDSPCEQKICEVICSCLPEPSSDSECESCICEKKGGERCCPKSPKKEKKCESCYYHHNPCDKCKKSPKRVYTTNP